MFNRSKGWLPGLLSKPKNPHSLEHLKYLYNVLCKNQTVTEQNRVLLVETLRSISEILIWGDQNDSSVFDFFLEKNMLTFFLRYMRQKFGRFICVQLLQTLNILFENISNETSLYYLLSNNHINSIIVHKFDFSDEEVMAYYISFLKTLSLKLNKHTIHFFYNEHTNDFALYTEAIKFFNHSEGMVRIAVRTITLNVYKVKDPAMLRYIRDRTAAPYFSNLVWFIGSHILDLNTCVRNDADHRSRDRLSTLVAEHLDHLHYLNDILLINIDTLNDVLTDQLLNRLLIPLYVYSLTKRKRYDIQMSSKKYVSSVVSLFLLSQVFLIIRHAPLVRQLAEIIFHGESEFLRQDVPADSPRMRVREFTAPDETLEETLEGTRGLRPRNESVRITEGNSTFYRPSDVPGEQVVVSAEPARSSSTDEVFEDGREVTLPSQNSTDEEKILSSTRSQSFRRSVSTPTSTEPQHTFSFENRPYLEAIFNALECTENDYEALFALCLLYAMGHNEGIHQGLMDAVFMPTERSETKYNYNVALMERLIRIITQAAQPGGKTKDNYNVALVERLIRIITLAAQPGSKVRLSTLELSMRLLRQLVYTPAASYLQDRHLAGIENARECSTQLLRNFYKSEEIFLDMFEDEYREMLSRPLNVEYLTMDASILLPPTGTPLTGIEFNKRLPCGEVERARRAIRVFFLTRQMSLALMQIEENQLPLTKDRECVKIDNILDLNNSDLIACTVVTKDKKQKRFLVIDALQMILVEPDIRRLGWGIVTFVGFLQNIEVTGDKEDSRSLHITVHKPASSHNVRPVPLLAARFIFDDHIRCMAAKQRLTKGRIKARQQKMLMVERLLDIPAEASSYSGHYGSRPIPGRSHPVRVGSSATERRGQSSTSTAQSHDQADSQSAAGDTESAANEGEATTEGANRSDTIHVEQGTESEVAGQKQRASTNSEEIEVAEEATSEMAFQTLHQPGSDSSGRHDCSSHESSPVPQEIPLEDMSRKSKSRKKEQLTRAKMTQSRLTAELKQQDRSRSSSQSPKRKSSSGATPKSKLRGRSTSLTSEAQMEARSRSGTPPERRQHIDSNPLPAGSKHRHKETRSAEIQTNLSIKLAKDRAGSTGSSHSDSSVGPSPKTLCPAQSPAVSLVQETDAVISKQIGSSPKLLPPAEVERIRSHSDTSQTGSETSEFTSSAGSSSNRSSDNFEPPDLGLKVPSGAEAQLSSASVSVETAGGGQAKVSGSASEQLTKLAQIVQHYKFEEEKDGQGEREAETAVDQ